MLSVCRLSGLRRRCDGSTRLFMLGMTRSGELLRINASDSANGRYWGMGLLISFGRVGSLVSLRREDPQPMIAVVDKIG
jgi:hypothetical protein